MLGGRYGPAEGKVLLGEWTSPGQVMNPSCLLLGAKSCPKVRVLYKEGIRDGLYGIRHMAYGNHIH